MLTAGHIDTESRGDGCWRFIVRISTGGIGAVTLASDYIYTRASVEDKAIEILGLMNVHFE